MATKQLKKINRIIFLKRFTQEIILNLSKEHDISRKIRIEKLKRKFEKRIHSPEKAFKKIINHRILKAPRYPKPGIKKEPAKPPITVRREPVQKTVPVRKEKETLPEIKKEKISEFNLGRMENLLNDSFIEAIECQGPGKNILVNKHGKTNLTKIILSQEEINDIIENFSREAKIPVVKGILKAAVGNLTISAVTSEFVGSRFIIQKNLY